MSGGKFSLTTTRQMEFVDITAQVAKVVAESGRPDGICCVYNPHTTGGLTINEGADPAVQEDILDVLRRLVPLDYPFRHLEGNSPAHLMASLMGSSVTVIYEGGRLRLGTWQKIFFCEFDGPRDRQVFWKIV
ncbi:MAG TPA: secondary thiamine-phosphate synthase enzyme YjbQ [Desulfurivibrionaceae bacterium]|nr:secondary thiamine-phosphate synthase enzyme YjbQ [Desulfurivibrionaceae bacterium]